MQNFSISLREARWFDEFKVAKCTKRPPSPLHIVARQQHRYHLSQGSTSKRRCHSSDTCGHLRLWLSYQRRQLTSRATSLGFLGFLVPTNKTPKCIKIPSNSKLSPKSLLGHARLKISLWGRQSLELQHRCVTWSGVTDLQGCHSKFYHLLWLRTMLLPEIIHSELNGQPRILQLLYFSQGQSLHISMGLCERG